MTSPGYVLGDREFTLVEEALNYRPGIGWARMLEDAEVQSISVPMLVICGAETAVSTPERVAARLTDLLPRAEVEIEAGTGRGILGHIPDQVIPRFMRFVCDHDDAKRSSLADLVPPESRARPGLLNAGCAPSQGARRISTGDRIT